MKNSYLITASLLILSIFTSINSAFSQNYKFIKNEGQLVDTADQTNNDIKFYVADRYVSTYFRQDGFDFLYQKDSDADVALDSLVRISIDYYCPPKESSCGTSFATSDTSLTDYNFYLSFLDSNGITDVKAYDTLYQSNIFSNIDLAHVGQPIGYKSLFAVKPGGDPEDIQFTINGQDSVAVRNDTFVKIFTPLEDPLLANPVGYTNAGQVDIEYTQISSNRIGLVAGSYDSTKTLYIEMQESLPAANNCPVGNLQYGSFFGSPLEQGLSESAYDDDGYLYLAGNTEGLIIPETPGLLTYKANQDVVVGRMNRNYQFRFITYYGSSGYDDVEGMDVSGLHHTTITGNVFGEDLPYRRTYSSTYMQYDNGEPEYGQNYVAEFDKNGFLHWSTYYGDPNANEDEEFKSLYIDSDLNVYIGGYSKDNNFPLKNPGSGYWYSNLNKEGVLLKFNYQGERLWATRFGGDATEILGITKDQNDNLFITGKTNGDNTYFDLKQENSSSYIQNNFGGGSSDQFYAKFDQNRVLQWSTYYGGGGIDVAKDIAVTNNGRIIATGNSRSTDFPTTDNYLFEKPFLSGGLDITITRFYGDGEQDWSTYYGDEGDEDGRSIAVGPDNYIYVAGYTQGTFDGGKYNPNPITSFTNNSSFFSVFDDDRYSTSGYLLIFNDRTDEFAFSFYGGGHEGQYTGHDDFGNSLALFERANIDQEGYEVAIAGRTTSLYDELPNLPICEYAPQWNGDYFQGDNAGGTRHDGFIGVIGFPEMVSGIEEGDIQNIQISPNPTKSTVVIKDNFEEEKAYKILDVNGRVVKSGLLIPGSTNTIDLPDQPQGLYLLKIEGMSESHKIVKQ